MCESYRIFCFFNGLILSLHNLLLNGSPFRKETCLFVNYCCIRRGGGKWTWMAIKGLFIHFFYSSFTESQSQTRVWFRACLWLVMELWESFSWNNRKMQMQMRGKSIFFNISAFKAPSTLHYNSEHRCSFL